MLTTTMAVLPVSLANLQSAVFVIFSHSSEIKVTWKFFIIWVKRIIAYDFCKINQNKVQCLKKIPQLPGQKLIDYCFTSTT